jgi:hypothetical protein
VEPVEKQKVIRFSALSIDKRNRQTVKIRHLQTIKAIVKLKPQTDGTWRNWRNDFQLKSYNEYDENQPLVLNCFR